MNERDYKNDEDYNAPAASRAAFSDADSPHLTPSHHYPRGAMTSSHQGEGDEPLQESPAQTYNGEQEVLIQDSLKQPLDELADILTKAEPLVKELKTVLRSIRRKEQAMPDDFDATSLLQMEPDTPETQTDESEDSTVSANLRSWFFAIDAPMDRSMQTEYYFCNITLSKLYHLLQHQVNYVDWYLQVDRSSIPTYVQDVIEQVGSASFHQPNGDSNGSSMSMTKLTLQKALVASSWLQLRPALQSGHGVWTSVDQSYLYNYCVLKRNSPLSLEEHPADPSFVQGDMKISVSGVPGYPKWNLPPESPAINYCFAEDLSTLTRAAFLHAIDHVTSHVPCLRFKQILHKPKVYPATCASLPSIVVKGDEYGCWTYLGQLQQPGHLMMGSQPINLGSGCELFGMAVHQLVTALGLPHEIARSDRDEFLSMNGVSDTARDLAHIFPKDYVSGFTGTNRKDPKDASDTFDYLSITMPASSAFSPDGFDTFEPTDMPILSRYFGQRHGLSENDAVHLAKLYGCQASKTLDMTKALNDKWLKGDGFALDGSCVDATYTGMGWTFGPTSETVAYSCPELFDRCPDWNTDSRNRMSIQTGMACPATCLQCVQPPASLQIYAGTERGERYNYSAAQSNGGLNEFAWKQKATIW